MSQFAKSMLLSFGLIAGATATAYAQSGNIAALPPSAPPTTVVVPSGAYPGPDPGRGFYPKETQSGRPCSGYVGPKPSSAGAPEPDSAGLVAAVCRTEAQLSCLSHGPPRRKVHYARRGSADLVAAFVLFSWPS